MAGQLPWRARPVYYLLRAGRRLAGRALWAVEHALLDLEAHYFYVDEESRSETYSLTVAKNREIWNGYDWGGSGEEWSPSPEWKAQLIREVLEPESVAALSASPTLTFSRSALARGVGPKSWFGKGVRSSFWMLRNGHSGNSRHASAPRTSCTSSATERGFYMYRIEAWPSPGATTRSST